MKESSKYFAFLCPHCKQTVIAERSVFSISAGKIEIPCPCGKSKLVSEYQGTSFGLQVPCVACGLTHSVSVPINAILKKDAIVLSCKRTGMECCAIGERDRVFSAAKRMESSADHLPDEGNDSGTFLNEIVMSEVLSEVKDIAARGGISCTCGSKDFGIDIHYASVVVKCKQCGAELRIPAATQEDIDNICCQNNLVIHSS